MDLRTRELVKLAAAAVIVSETERSGGMEKQAITRSLYLSALLNRLLQLPSYASLEGVPLAGAARRILSRPAMLKEHLGGFYRPPFEDLSQFKSLRVIEALAPRFGDPLNLGKTQKALQALLMARGNPQQVEQQLRNLFANTSKRTIRSASEALGYGRDMHWYDPGLLGERLIERAGSQMSSGRHSLGRVWPNRKYMIDRLLQHVQSPRAAEALAVRWNPDEVLNRMARMPQMRHVDSLLSTPSNLRTPEAQQAIQVLMMGRGNLPLMRKALRDLILAQGGGAVNRIQTLNAMNMAGVRYWAPPEPPRSLLRGISE